MPLDSQQAVKELSEAMREAIKAGQIELALRLEKKINQLIEYGSKIPA